MEKKENKRRELQCVISPLSTLSTYKYVVICSRYKGKWLLSRHKKRDTWETQGGHIEPGETPEQAARRELREETGLRLTAITHVLPPAACTVGIGDERTVCVFGTAEGTFRPSTDPMEEIESAWYSRAQVRALHETDLFGSWALAYSWMFANGCLPGV